MAACDLCGGRALPNPCGWARQILLLLDGSFAVVLLHRDPGYMETAGEAASSLNGGGDGAAGPPALARATRGGTD
jgi:hypothetical protein